MVQQSGASSVDNVERTIAAELSLIQRRADAAIAVSASQSPRMYHSAEVPSSCVDSHSFDILKPSSGAWDLVYCDESLGRVISLLLVIVRYPAHDLDTLHTIEMSILHAAGFWITEWIPA